MSSLEMKRNIIIFLQYVILEVYFYFYLKIKGKQYKVAQGDLLTVDRVKADVGELIKLNKVLLVGSKNYTSIGRPLVENIEVFARIEQHTHSKKVIVFKKKKRKGYRRWKGNEQLITMLRIE